MIVSTSVSISCHPIQFSPTSQVLLVLFASHLKSVFLNMLLMQKKKKESKQKKKPQASNHLFLSSRTDNNLRQMETPGLPVISGGINKALINTHNTLAFCFLHLLLNAASYETNLT